MNIILFLIHSFFVFIFVIYILFVKNIKLILILFILCVIIILTNLYYGDCPMSIIEDKHGDNAFMDMLSISIFPKKFNYTRKLRPLVTLELIYIGGFLIITKILVLLLLKYFKKNIVSMLKYI